MRLYDIATIASIHGVSINSVNYWVSKTDLVPVKVDREGRRFYNKNQVNTILKKSPAYRKPHKLVKCIDMYLRGFNAVEIAKASELCTVSVSKIVKQYRADNNTITVESKLNFMI